MAPKLFDVDRQLTFYGAYHSNKINVLIHILCVPLLVWSSQVLGTKLPTPAFVPKIHHELNDYLVFDLNIPTIQAILYLAYYFILEPVAAVLYVPQLALSVLTATAYARGSGHIGQAGWVQGLCWLAQFLGHGLAEGRAPALLDNLLASFVLAPFFVHLEVLFALGYNPALHKRIQNAVGVEIAKFRKAQGDKKRAKQL